MRCGRLGRIINSRLEGTELGYQLLELGAAPGVPSLPCGVNGQLQLAHLDLNADKLGPLRLVVLVEPVGVHQPRRVLVGVGDDRGEKASFVVHDSSSS